MPVLVMPLKSKSGSILHDDTLEGFDYTLLLNFIKNETEIESFLLQQNV
jgi:hypothetical protein